MTGLHVIAEDAKRASLSELSRACTGALPTLARRGERACLALSPSTTNNVRILWRVLMPVRTMRFDLIVSTNVPTPTIFSMQDGFNVPRIEAARLLTLVI